MCWGSQGNSFCLSLRASVLKQGTFLSSDDSRFKNGNSYSMFRNIIRQRTTWRWDSGTELGSMDLVGSRSYHTYIER